MLAVGAGRARPETAEKQRHRARECITCDDRLTAAGLTIDVPPMLSANSAGRRLTAFLAYGVSAKRNHHRRRLSYVLPSILKRSTIG